MMNTISNPLLRSKQILALLRCSSSKYSSGKLNNISGAKTGIVGLSEKCLKVPSTPVGPKAAKNNEYKNPEYFCYHVDSFGEAEVELAKYRLPAPSNKVPFQR